MHLPKDNKGRAKLAGILVAAIVAYFLYKRYFPEIHPEELLDDLSGALGQWTYPLVMLLAFLETGAFIGLIAPGETFVVLAGAIAGQGETNVFLTIALVWLGAFLGDTCSFVLGVKLGRGFVVKHGPRVRITPERFAQVESYFDKHGGKTILIGRFIGLVRALAPFIAGSSGMRYAAMAPYSILGTGLWASFFTLLGYFAGKNLDEIFAAAEKGFLYFAFLVGAIVFLVVAIRYLRVPANRQKTVAEMEERRWLRPLVVLGRRLTPQARFLWNRLTPGNLGLELTAPLAALAVGSFVFIAYAVVVGDNPGPTGADQTAMNIVGDIRSDWLTSVAKVITALGSLWAIIPVALIAAFVFARTGHKPELAILIAGTVLLIVLSPLMKELIDRPRPPDSLVEATSSSYPSGHAAHSVLYAWLAVAATLRLRPRWSGGTALLTAGIVLTAAIGLSRVYLGAHYLSDVSGGWGLGVSAFAVATVVSVLVIHLRQNRVDAA